MQPQDAQLELHHRRRRRRQQRQRPTLGRVHMGSRRGCEPITLLMHGPETTGGRAHVFSQQRNPSSYIHSIIAIAQERVLMLGRQGGGWREDLPSGAWSAWTQGPQ